jgi:acetolactate synthase I/III small subunit
VIQQEVALYKISTSVLSGGLKISKLINEVNARIITIESEYIIIEKVGHPEETENLYKMLEPYGIIEFARSGIATVIQSTKKLNIV